MELIQFGPSLGTLKPGNTWLPPRLRSLDLLGPYLHLNVLIKPSILCISLLGLSQSQRLCHVWAPYPMSCLSSTTTYVLQSRRRIGKESDSVRFLAHLVKMAPQMTI